MSETITPAYSCRYEHALGFAARLHAEQGRKAAPGSSSTIPYIMHLLEVSALVWQDGGDEDQAIAALLHDAIEDQSERVTYEEIEQLYGAEVSRIVRACTDGEPGKVRGPGNWKERKQEYLAHLEHTDAKALLVTVADKVSNARAILDDLDDASDPLSVWGRFNAPLDDILWYYTEVSTIASAKLPQSVLTRRLNRLTQDLAARAAESAD